jgi:hypothetical protein
MLNGSVRNDASGASPSGRPSSVHADVHADVRPDVHRNQARTSGPCPPITRAARDRGARDPVPSRPVEDLNHAEGVDLREEPEKGPRLAEPVAARRPSARAARGGSFTERDFRRLCAVMRQEHAASPFATQAALLEHVSCVANLAGIPHPPEAMTRLAGVLASLAAREREDHEAAWRDRCRRAGHHPRCQDADHCTLRILRRSVGPHVTLDNVRKLRAAKEGR